MHKLTGISNSRFNQVASALQGINNISSISKKSLLITEQSKTYDHLINHKSLTKDTNCLTEDFLADELVTALNYRVSNMLNVKDIYSICLKICSLMTLSDLQKFNSSLDMLDVLYNLPYTDINSYVIYRAVNVAKDLDVDYLFLFKLATIEVLEGSDKFEL